MALNIDNNILKNISKRTSQLGLIAFSVSIGLAVYYYFLGLHVAAVMVACFGVASGIILFLQYLKVFPRAQTFIIAAICSLLIVSSFVEGAGTGQYFYFFAVIVVIPIVV